MLHWTVAALLCAGGVLAGEDKGESKECRALKGRSKAPLTADVDAQVSLEALLNKKGEKDWSTSRAGVVEGYVIQVEREEDGDYHLVLASQAGEANTTKWVILEVPPRWAKKTPALAGAKLRALKGKKIRATGWLFHEPEEDEGGDPRGTLWELHPVTALEVMGK